MPRIIPKPEVMFRRLLSILGAEESGWNPQKKVMSRGLTMEIQHGMPGLAIQVATHDGKGGGVAHFLYARGAGAFAEKVWAVEAGLELKRRVG